MSTTRDIAVASIDRDEAQPRKTFDALELEGLAKSIKQNGLIQPITIRPRGRRFVIVAGERRWRAHKLLNAKTIACNVVPERDAATILCAQLVENMQRAEMTELEEAAAFQVLVDSGLDEATIAERLGVAVFRVRWRLQLLNLAPEVRKLVESGNLTIQHANEVARLATHHDQRRLVQMLNRGEIRGWKALRLAVDTANGETSTEDLFGVDSTPTTRDVAIVRGMEDKIERMVALANSGWKEGQCVIAAKVSPDRASHMADKLQHLAATLRTMERELRQVHGQVRMLVG